MGRYTTGSVCNLCHDNPSRLEAAAQITTEAEMFGGNKWKSAQYPDGCSACPEDERLKRKHAARGLCSRCYYAERRAGEIAERDAKAEATEAGRANLSLVPAERDDDGVPTVDRLLSSQAGAAGVALPPGDDKLITEADNHESDRAGSFHVKENGMPGFVCERLPEWASEIIQDPEGIDAIERAELGEDVDTDAAPITDPACQPCCGDFADCDRPCTPRGRWQRDQEIRRDACASSEDEPRVKPEPEEDTVTDGYTTVINFASTGLYVPGGVDPELAAAEQVRAALEGLDEAARLRVVKWVCDRFQITEG